MKRTLLSLWLAVVVCAAYAQQRTVTGKVTSSEDGSSLPGVNVVVKGTTNGTVTDVNGTFSIVASPEATLTFSFIGFNTSDVIVGDKTNIDVALISDVTQLSEVVVTGAGISRESRTLGYSVSNIKNDFLTQAQVTNAAAALSGKVSGLQINQVDNSVNGSVRIVLRGNRSLLGNNQALLVVDGAQVPTDFINSINPNDIESTTILKGPTAAAIYGSQASNGVLIINTKQGSKAPEVTFNSTTQLESISYFPRLQNRFGLFGGEGPGADVFNIDPNGPLYIAYENQNYGPEFNGQQIQYGRPLYKNGAIDPSTIQLTSYSPKLNDHYNFFNTGVTSQNSVSVSAGSDRSKFFFSFQDVNKSGTMPADQYRRDVMRLNSNTTYGIFTLGYTASYTIEKQNVSGNPAAVYNDWFNTGLHIPLTQLKDWRNNRYASPTGYFNDFTKNPYYDIDAFRAIKDRQDFQGNLDLSLKPTKWLTLSEKISLYNSTVHNQNQNMGERFDQSFANPAKARIQNGETPPSVNDFYSTTGKINSIFLATLNHDITQDFSGQLVLGNNVIIDKYNQANIGSATLLPLDPIIYNPTSRNGDLAGNTQVLNSTLIGFFGDLTLTYKYLTVHGSIRNDQTSLLAANNRSFTYPGADLAFVFTEAIPALRDNKIITFGKITFASAKVGNVNLNPYQLQTVFNAGIPFSGSAGNVPINYLGGTIVSSDLKPEFTYANEVGLEMGFLANRITLKTSYYETQTINQTVPFNVSSSTGYTRALVNTGELDNKGLEIDISFNAINTASGFRWTIAPNYTQLIDNSVKSIYTSPTGDVLNSIQITNNNNTTISPITNVSANNLAGSNSFAIIGQQYPTIQVSDYKRDPQGRVIVDRNTGLPSIATGLVMAGQGQPKHRFGIQNTFSYRGLSLGVLLDYRSGGVIFNQIGNSIEFGGLGFVSAEAGRQKFVYPNSVYSTDGGATYTPNTNITVNDGNYNFWQNLYNNVGTNYISSSDFWKLREVSLSYKLPTSVIAKTKVIKAATLTLTGRNLLMWRPNNNQWTDPEFAPDNSNALGTTTVAQTPPTRTYGLSIQLTF